MLRFCQLPWLFAPEADDGRRVDEMDDTLSDALFRCLSSSAMAAKGSLQLYFVACKIAVRVLYSRVRLSWRRFGLGRTGGV